MTTVSAGLLMYQIREGQLEVFLGHMGGPFFRHKDAGAWTIPKGIPNPGESALDCALREFEEETGMRPDAETYLPLGSIVQKGGKHVQAWAFEGTWGDRELVSQHVDLEWPPRSGRHLRFPELDQVGFFTLPVARDKLVSGQRALLDRLVQALEDE